MAVPEEYPWSTRSRSAGTGDAGTLRSDFVLHPNSHAESLQAAARACERLPKSEAREVLLILGLAAGNPVEGQMRRAFD